MISRQTLITAAAALMFALLCAGPARTAETQTKLEDYRVLSTRNIFTKNRGGPNTRTNRGPTSAPPPERFMFLRGVVKRGDELEAVFENMNSGEMLNLKPGDKLLNGTIVKVDLNGVTFTQDSKTSEIPIGQNLEKSNTPAETVSATGSSSGPAGKADVLERLRQRRMKELGK